MSMNKAMSAARIKTAVPAFALMLSACGGGVNDGNDTIRSEPAAGAPEALAQPDTPAKNAGMIIMKSAHPVSETVQRLEQAVRQKGGTVFATIDHQANAKQAGADLRPTTLVLFGNPKLGTPLIEADQTIGIDLPQRAVVYTDKAGQTWIAYDDPAWVAARHGVTGEAETLRQTSAALDGFVRSAAN